MPQAPDWSGALGETSWPRSGMFGLEDRFDLVVGTRIDCCVPTLAIQL